jgi:hypothetical protein
MPYPIMTCLQKLCTNHGGFEVFAAVVMKDSIFLDAMSSSLLEIGRVFE